MDNLKCKVTVKFSVLITVHCILTLAIYTQESMVLVLCVYLCISVSACLCLSVTTVSSTSFMSMLKAMYCE